MVDIKHLRSFLFVPANRPDRFAKAAEAGADAIIVDLEDAVPVAAKEEARESLRAAFSDRPILLRINAHRTPWYELDIEAARSLPFDAIILPKAEQAATIERTAGEVQKPVIALIESATGLANAREIAQAQGVVQLAFGSIDFCADLGCEHHREILMPARFELVLASRLAGIVPPIDGVTVQVDAPEIVQDDAANARALGMGGKLCIHPKQILPVMSAFRPTDAEVSWARKIIASGDGAAMVDGTMVDEPVRIKARAILAAAG